MKGAKVHFASLMDICHLKNAELETKAPKKQRSSCTPRRCYERWFWFLCSFHRTRIISITNDCSKSHGDHIQTARVRRTSSWCSICLYPGKNGRCSKIIENSQIGMSRHLDSSTTTQVAKIMVQYGRSSRSSWAKSAYSYTVKNDYFYLCMWMTKNWLERTKILIRCVKYSIKKLIWENQHHSLIMYTWAALNDNGK